jgi:hypothetical protein
MNGRKSRQSGVLPVNFQKMKNIKRVMAYAGGIARCLGRVILCETLRFLSLSLLLLQQYFWRVALNPNNLPSQRR